jgi:chromosome segregation ATPase
LFSFFVERVAELEATVQSLEQQMQDQEEEANNVISQWQESCTASDDTCSELKRELEEVRKDKESLDKALESGGSVQVESPATNEEELLKKLNDTQEELKIAKETLSRDEVVVHQWEGTFI